MHLLHPSVWSHAMQCLGAVGASWLLTGQGKLVESSGGHKWRAWMVTTGKISSIRRASSSLGVATGTKDMLKFVLFHSVLLFALYNLLLYNDRQAQVMNRPVKTILPCAERTE